MRIGLLKTFIAALVVASTSALAANGPSGSAVPSAVTAGTLTVVKAVTYSGTNNEVVATLPVTGTTDDGGGSDIVCGNIWDDGTVKVSQCLSVPVGTTQTLTFTLDWTGAVLTGAPGVGLYMNDATSAATPTTGGSLGIIDPLFLALTSPVPTLSQWSLMLLVALVVVGAVILRRRMHHPPAA
jgi:hypothetical protein